jgi:hypothetical protein
MMKTPDGMATAIAVGMAIAMAKERQRQAAIAACDREISRLAALAIRNPFVTGPDFLIIRDDDGFPIEIF